MKIGKKQIAAGIALFLFFILEEFSDPILDYTVKNPIPFAIIITIGAIWVIKELKKPEPKDENCIDLENGLDWFLQYKKSGAKTLSEFFNLQEKNKLKIKATIAKAGFYKTSEGKRWTIIAKYFDNNNRKEYTFYCPGFDYNPSNDFKEGDSINVWIEKGNYSKYDIQIY